MDMSEVQSRLLSQSVEPSDNSSDVLLFDASRNSRRSKKKHPTVKRAEELLRMCNLKFEPGTFGVGEVAKAVICFDIACHLMGSTAVDARKAAKLSGMSPPAYARARAAIQNALGVRSQLSLPQLALQFGCMRVLESTQRNLHVFTARFTAALPEARRGGTDFSRPAYLAAALMLTATRNQLKMDVDRLLEAKHVGKDEFQQVVACMEAHCADLFGSSHSCPTPSKAQEHSLPRQHPPVQHQLQHQHGRQQQQQQPQQRNQQQRNDVHRSLSSSFREPTLRASRDAATVEGAGRAEGVARGEGTRGAAERDESLPVRHAQREQCTSHADVAHLHRKQHQQHVPAADVAEQQRSTTSAEMAPQQQAVASNSNSTMPVPQAKLTLLKRPSGHSGKLCQAKLLFKRVKTAAA
ncbi:unnamed protein product [Closterium sp. Naga37s-1]|nr:unnamed protein product [Closterium sp. Naga37s-1]